MEIKIPYKPRAYQLEAHSDPHKFQIDVWHRQSGKTTRAINHLVREMVLNPGVYLYVAPEKSQAKNIVWKDPTVLFKYLPAELISRKNEVELTVYLKPTWKDGKKQAGSVFYIEGADNVDRLRGLKPRGVILDEYAQMKPGVWEEILFPAINQSGGWVVFIGTFKGKNHFYNMFSKYWDWAKGEPIPDDNYSVSYLPYWKNEFFTKEQEQRARDIMTPEQFNQEYGCIPMSGTSNVFPSLVELMTGSLKQPSNHMYSMGVDLAKHKDWTAVSIIDRNTNELVFQERWQGDWGTTIEKIILIRNKYNKAHITIDSTGVGDPIAEMLARRGVKCDDFKFSNKSKDQLIKKMSLFFSEKKIKLPSQDQVSNLITELEQYSYEILPTGKIKYSAPTGLHDDEVMSLGLAIWFLKDELCTETFATGNPRTSIPNLDVYSPSGSSGAGIL